MSVAVASKRRPRRPKKPTPRSRGLVVPLEELVTAANVRYMCGVTQRRTLIRWREDHGFPAPVLKTDGVELWDAREVRAWLRERDRSQT